MNETLKPPGLEDFKFKRSSGDTLTRYELTPEPKVPPGFPPPNL